MQNEMSFCRDMRDIYNMYSFYRNLKPLYRRLIHLGLLSIIFILPGVFKTPEDIPSGLMALWIIAFFSEAAWILIGHAVHRDYDEINHKAVKKIQGMKADRKRKKAESLHRTMKNLMILNPGIRLNRDEDCLYKGEAIGIRDPKIIKAYLEDDAPEGIEEEVKDSCPGLLYITNQRMIFEGARNRFNLKFSEIRQAQYYSRNFIIYTRDYPYVIETRDSKNVIFTFNVINQYSAAIE